MVERFLMFYLAGLMLLCVLAIMAFSGCTSQPSCYEMPHNMRCMTAPDLERELSIKP